MVEFKGSATSRPEAVECPTNVWWHSTGDWRCLHQQACGIFVTNRTGREAYWLADLVVNSAKQLATRDKEEKFVRWQKSRASSNYFACVTARRAAKNAANQAKLSFHKWPVRKTQQGLRWPLRLLPSTIWSRLFRFSNNGDSWRSANHLWRISRLSNG